MAEICCGVVSESETSSPCEPSSRAARRRRMEIRRFKFVTGLSAEPDTLENGRKRPKVEDYTGSVPRDCENAVETCSLELNKRSVAKNIPISELSISVLCPNPSIISDTDQIHVGHPKFGVSSVCGRRRDMEDAVAICPSFCRQDPETTTELHYYGVYDGHGCSHVRVLGFV